MNYHFPIVKTITKRLTVLFAAGITILCLQFTHPPQSLQNDTDDYYRAQLKKFQQTILAFKKACQKKEPLSSLRQHFFLSRIAYKKLGVLTEYFNSYETKLLNGPALDRIEEDNPDMILPPRGLQAAEALLFSNWKNSSYTLLYSLLEDILLVISRLENEPDRIYKFREELVWDALRSAMVRLTALGITGFDSPVAQYSLTEAKASIAGMSSILGILKKHYHSKYPQGFANLSNQLTKASTYLAAHSNFNRFDRFEFITRYINPFYAELIHTRLLSGVPAPMGKNPVNFNAPSIFAEKGMDINFFAPMDYAVTRERIELGEKLFSDPLLSGTNTRSCASCHIREKAFADGLAVPNALDEKTLLKRNTPTLWNTALQTRQFYDSRTDLLENQLNEVVHNPEEMQGSLKNSAAELNKIPAYKELFGKAYPSEKESITGFNIANAISSYVRSLVALNSAFDRAIRGEKATLSVSEKNGFNLFAGKAKCATCHFIPLFNGLVPPAFTETESEVLGIPKTKNKKAAELDSDYGKFGLTTSVIHKYSFKTPTLRNIALTAPYMHNGVFTTLEEVMEFYNHGGGKGLKIAPPNQTLPFDRLNLSAKEITDMIHFMKTLTDTTYTLSF